MDNGRVRSLKCLIIDVLGHRFAVEIQHIEFLSKHSFLKYLRNLIFVLFFNVTERLVTLSNINSSIILAEFRG
jgi:hypothetical protein